MKLVKDESLLDAAAIASERAAQIYGMKVLVKDLGDYPNNYTRFFVLSKNDSPYRERQNFNNFSIKSFPGALYSVLEEFAARNINLTKIESRQPNEHPGSTTSTSTLKATEAKNDVKRH